MELNEATIAELKIDEIAVMNRIATELGIKTSQVSAVVTLIGEGCTVPFISRYRKERTGSLDEVQVRDSAHKFESYKNLEERRIEVIKGIFELGKLSEELFKNIKKASTLAEIEDIWTPFKKKKKTRGMLAEERGLAPLAEIMLSGDEKAVEEAAPAYVRESPDKPELAVASPRDAIQGAMDILAERLSQDPDNRAAVKSFYLKSGSLKSKGVGDEAKKEKSTYQMYWDYAEPLNTLKPHRVLAVNRGEREGELEVSLEVDEDEAVELLKHRASPNNRYHAEAIDDGLRRLLSPAVLRELRSDALEAADGHGIEVFSENLKNLLMQPPIKGTRVLGVDPGIRTGTKCAALDETGKFLDYFVIYQEQKPEEARKAIAAAIKKHDMRLVAVGNGTASHEVQEIVAAAIGEAGSSCEFTVVDEDGASVYSASDVAREEFPELDLTIRGAISIGRRLQDPLAELVKIDPKSIGVGLYQHDVNQKKLSEGLDEVVGSVVNRVGVNLNTASQSLLRYVSGINSGLAKKIVKYREANGRIPGRDKLRDIPGLGEKTFEQCAGFLKIPESPNPLDNTWVHPENYALAEELLPVVRGGRDPSHEERAALKAKYSVGETTLDDIVAELKKPNRDPREGFPKPILQKGVIKFEDLHEGMIVKGKVKNVVDFGAFVDIGIKESALIHVSEMSDRFVKDPMEALKVGDVKDFRIISLDAARKRIGLSLKSDGSQGGGRQGGQPRGEGHAQARPGREGQPRREDTRREGPAGDSQGGAPSGARRVVVVKKGAEGGQRPQPQGGAQRRDEPRRDGYSRDDRGPRQEKSWEARKPAPKEDDGTMYNPFAELLKGKVDKDKKK
ncbi:MAG: helix-hairpin-helix domain-containing protein [Spirochaetaceae bacterium]|nr:helix-hairpin-helix domain-containing protein [Spirochaetaceae bacterium]